MRDLDLHIQENVPLAPLTTLGVGGPARFFTRATTPDEVADAVMFAKARELPLFVFGGGSNLLISDKGWNGLVLQIAIGGVQVRRRGEKLEFEVGAGEEWDELVARAVTQDCAGIECLSGIPGTVGGTPVQNVGAYGQEVSETIISVLTFDLAENQIRELTASECGFSYRGSVFNSSQRGRHIILRVTYLLDANGEPSLRYADLERYFSGRDGSPTLAAVREAVLTIRAAKGMLITPGDPDSRSAGSFFKNPVLSESDYRALLHRAAARDLEIPSYPALAQHHKISAAWLVENSGFKRGYARGNAAISSKHALSLVNRGGASATEILALKDEIQDRVAQTWGVSLQPEPVLVGI